MKAKIDKELKESDKNDLETYEYDKIFEMALQYKQNNGMYNSNSPDIVKSYNDNDPED